MKEKRTMREKHIQLAWSRVYVPRVDNAFLVSLVGLRPEKYFWLGLSNQNDIDNFVWTNGNLVTFTHWNAQMPGVQRDITPFQKKTKHKQD